MRRIAAWLMIPAILLCLTACRGRSHSSTPGNIARETQEPYTPPSNENARDVSGDYLKELCTYPWLDTYSMEYYQLAEDGTFARFEDYEDGELIQRDEDGSWQLLKNEAGQLTLSVSPADGEAFNLYELELNEHSIYARGIDDFIFIWLLAEPED